MTTGYSKYIQVLDAVSKLIHPGRITSLNHCVITVY